MEYLLIALPIIILIVEYVLGETQLIKANSIGKIVLDLIVKAAKAFLESQKEKEEAKKELKS